MALEIDDINLGGTLSATTISATTIVFGGQPIQNIFVQEVPGGFLAKSGGTVTGETLFNGGLSANTFFSGSTNLYDIFSTGGPGGTSTYVQPGTNIATGGTAIEPIISLVDSPSINNLTISGLTSSSDGATFVKLSGTTIFVGNSTTGGTIQAEKELILQQTGDTFGSSILRLRNRNGENGAIFETTDPTITLVDYIFKTSINQRNIRYEARSGSVFLSAPEFEFGPAANPSLVIGDAGILVRGSGGTRSTSLSSTTISANTINVTGQLTGADGATFTSLSGTNIFSGNTNLQNYFNTINGQFVTKANLSGATFTDQVNTPILSATTLSANTSVFVSSFKFPVSPVAGYILTSDASGNASWAASPTSGSGTTKLDIQSVTNLTTTPTATSALVDVAGMTLTTRNLGSSATTYFIDFSGTFSNNNNAGNSTFRLVKNGVAIPNALVTLTNAGASLTGAFRAVSLTFGVTGLTNGDVIKVQMSASTGTVTARNKSLNIIGTLNANLV